MKIKYLFYVFCFIMNLKIQCQENLDCKKLYSLQDSLQSLYISDIGNPATYLGKWEDLRIMGTDSMDLGKIFVRFIVDTLGQVRCPEVVKSDNKNLNSLAIDVIKSLSFEAAQNEGVKFMSYMHLPVFYGKSSRGKHKRKNKL